MKINVIVIDDEKLARQLILNYLSERKDINVVAECSNGFEGAKAINELKPDLIFLDIQMPKINGFELLELIDHTPEVIFTTAYDQYAIQAFEKNAIDYLLKPFSLERFNAAVDKALHKIELERGKNENKILPEFEPSEHLNRVVVKNKNKIIIIPTGQIYYLSAQDDYVEIVSGKGKFLKKKTLSFYENNLDDAVFIRIHRSTIINIDYLDRLELSGKEQYVAIMKDGNKLIVSKSGYSKLKEKANI